MVNRIVVTYNDTMTAAILAAGLRAGDQVVASSGPGNVGWLNATITKLAPLGVPVIVQTKGLTDLAAVVAAVHGAAGFSYDYEPDPAIPEFSWNFVTSVNNVEQATADGATTISPTGRPLLEADLQTYGWDYSGFLTPALPLIQTQTWVRQGLFLTALSKLKSQFGSAAFVPEISVAADTNGVDNATAVAAAQAAATAGCASIFLWWNLAAQLTAFLAAT